MINGDDGEMINDDSYEQPMQITFKCPGVIKEKTQLFYKGLQQL